MRELEISALVDDRDPAAPAVTHLPSDFVALDSVVGDLGVGREKVDPTPMVADTNVVLHEVAANDQFRSVRRYAGPASRDIVRDDVVQDGDARAGGIDAAAELLLVLRDGGTRLVFLDHIVRDRRRAPVDIEPTAHPQGRRQRAAPSAGDKEAVYNAGAGLLHRHYRVLAVALQVGGVGSRVAHFEVARGPTGITGR